MPENPQVKSAEFIKSAVAPDGYPDLGLPEIAVAGRSNVGKSSLINTLVNRRRLAKVSNTPGRTQLLNFFNINEQFVLCDLPGYGYAKVPTAIRRAWGPMVETYLANRRGLVALLVLVDCRREPGAWERDLVGFASAHGRAVVPVATKIDKLPKSKRAPVLAQMARTLGVPTHQLVPWSSLSGDGMETLWRRLQRFVVPPEPMVTVPDGAAAPEPEAPAHPADPAGPDAPG